MAENSDLPIEESAAVDAAPEAVVSPVPVELPAAEVPSPAAELPAAAPEKPRKAAGRPKAVKVAETPAPAPAPIEAEPEPVSAAAKPARAPRAGKAGVAKPRTIARTPRVPAVTPALPAAAKPAKVRRVPAKRVVSAKRAPTPTKALITTTAPLGKGKPKLAQIKDTLMATPFDTFKSAFTDLQDKAKAAFEKSTAAFGEASEFAKGNVDAFVQSGKILSSGLQDLGTTMVAETRGAFDTLAADAKELAAAKSPTEFFQLQSAIARKQFDGAVAQTSKSTEAFLKLANDTFAPLSSRVTLAVEKVSKAA